MFNNLFLNRILFVFFSLLLLGCRPSHSNLDQQKALDYLKSLEGQWIVYGDKESPFFWEFDLTARGNVVQETLKVGTSTEMATTYYMDNGQLIARHFCQLQNQPVLYLTESEIKGDHHFICDEEVGNTQSHNELHMHGVHFLKQSDTLVIWMDMYENNKKAFETRYKMVKSIN
jgi:hypothetical protein